MPVEVPDFDAAYRADPDPWRVRSSFYEQRKLAVVLACLQRPRYGLAWDPGCGIGELAARLADRADAVLASDASGEAIELARARCAGRRSVTVRQAALPADPPVGLQLIVLSEFFYYLTSDDRSDSLQRLQAGVAPGTELLAVHWRPLPHDAYLSGAEVQAEIGRTLGGFGWDHPTHHDDKHFVLDVFVRAAP